MNQAEIMPVNGKERTGEDEKKRREEKKKWGEGREEGRGRTEKTMPINEQTIKYNVKNKNFWWERKCTTKTIFLDLYPGTESIQLIEENNTRCTGSCS